MLARAAHLEARPLLTGSRLGETTQSVCAHSSTARTSSVWSADLPPGMRLLDAKILDETGASAFGRTLVATGRELLPSGGGVKLGSTSLVARRAEASRDDSASASMISIG